MKRVILVGPQGYVIPLQPHCLRAVGFSFLLAFARISMDLQSYSNCNAMVYSWSLSQEKTMARIIATHSGPFHADDVFAVALLNLLVNEEYEVVRTRDQSIINNAEFAIDVGGVHDAPNGRFDHHQNDYTGTKSSVGLLLDWLSAPGGYVSEFAADELRSCLIDELDDADTNGTPSAMSLLIWSMNPQWNDAEPGDFDKKFGEAVKFAEGVLDSFLKQAESKELAKMRLDTIARSGEVVESECYLPDMAFEVAKRSEDALFVIWPSSETQWMVQCVPPVGDRTSQRLPFQANIAGLRGEELEAVVGDLGSDIKPASVFVHKGAFIGGASTREGAFKLANFALQQVAELQV